MDIPILANPVHNNSQNLTFICEGSYIVNPEELDPSKRITVNVTLLSKVNLLTKSISYTEIQSDGTKKTGSASLNGIISKAVDNEDISITLSESDGKYRYALVSFNILYLTFGYTGHTITPTSFSIVLDTLSYSDFIIYNIINKSKYDV